MLLRETVKLLHLLLVQLFLEAIEHSVEGYFGGIGNIGEDGVLQIPTNGFVDLRCELFTQGLAFAVDVAVASPTEIDALEGTSVVSSGLEDLGESHVAVLADGKSLAGEEFVDAIGGKVEGGLDDRTFAGDHKHLFVPVPEGGTDGPRVAHGEHLATACEAAEHVAAIE